MAAKIGATTGTHEYPQSELPLCLSGSSAWRMRGPRSRAGFKAGPVGPPSEATKVATRKPSPMWAVPRLFLEKGALVIPEGTDKKNIGPDELVDETVKLALGGADRAEGA